MSDSNPFGLWQRPNFQLRSLPIDIRWEVTRRHSVYQAFWGPFDIDLDLGEETQTLVESLLGKLRQYLLGLIGVAGECPNPKTEIEQLGGEVLKSGWISGAVHPLTNRQLVALLIASLPQETLQYVGMCMMYAGAEKDVDGEPRKHIELRKLKSMEMEGLDGYIDQPMVSINPAASSRDIRSALDCLLVEWKEERGLSEQRVPSKEKLKAYLEVWDLREGWHRGHYQRSRETRFREIAEVRKVSIKTIHNQYRNAFEMVTGHKYSVDNWVELFGPLKLSTIFGDLGEAARLRPLIEKTRRAIPESVISSGKLPGFVSQSSRSMDYDFARILSKIKQLFSAGKSDEEIANELELPHPEHLPRLRQLISNE